MRRDNRMRLKKAKYFCTKTRLIVLVLIILLVIIRIGFYLIDRESDNNSNTSENNYNDVSVKRDETKKHDITQNHKHSTSEMNDLNHSHTLIEGTQSKFVNPYDIKNLLSLLKERPVSLQAELAKRLDLGVSYYVPSKNKRSYCAKEMNKTFNDNEKKNNVRNRIMAYHSIPHPTCLAELIFRYFGDISEKLKEENSNFSEKEYSFLRRGWGRKMFHNIDLEDNNGMKNEPFPFLPNSTAKLKSFMRAFNSYLKYKPRYSNMKALSLCWKMGGVIPGSSRHPRDAVFFDITDVYYAGGRFILFVEDNISYTNSKTQWTSSSFSSFERWILKQEILTNTEVNAVMQESVIPASKTAKLLPLRLAKVILHFGNVYPFVKGSWPQHTRDTLPLFIVFTKPLLQTSLDAAENNLERYTVGYYQEATDFQVPHHTLVEIIITSFMTQQHFLRTNKINLYQKNQTGYALAITSRPYYTHGNSYSPNGCHESFDRCLFNGPWGGMYIGQLQYLSASIQQRNCSICKEQTQECFEAQLSSTFQLYNNNNNNSTFQKRWVYGLGHNETQFNYINEKSENNWEFNKSSNSYHIGNIVDISNINKDFLQSSINSSEAVFHLEHLLIGYPTHCEPLLGLDPVYADIIHSLFHPILSDYNYSTYQEFLEKILQHDKKEEITEKPSFTEWKQWIALFYFSYNDCQEHLSRFRKLHMSKAIFDVLKEEGKLINNIQKSNSKFSCNNNNNGSTVILSLSEEKGPGNINNLINYLIHQVSNDLASTISLDSIATTTTIQLSDVFRFLLGNPKEKTARGIMAETIKGLSNNTTMMTTDYCSNDVFIFYSSRSGEWARDVVNDYVLLPKLPSNVEEELNKNIPFTSNNSCQRRRVHFRMNRFNQTFSFGKQLFSQMEAHHTTIFIGAPGANLLNSLFLRPTSGVITFSWGPTVDRVFYPTSVFPLYEEINNDSKNNTCNSGKSCKYQTNGLLWRSVALKQICNHKLRVRKKCRLGADNVNNLFIGDIEYKRLVTAVVDLVQEQDKIRREAC